MRWPPRGADGAIRADVALRWRVGGDTVAATSVNGAAALGFLGTGERRCFAGGEGYEQGEEDAGSALLTQATQGCEALAGDEENGGGEIGVNEAAAIRACSGEDSARTGSAAMWRSR